MQFLIIYTVSTILFSLLCYFIIGKTVKKQETKDLILKIVAVLTVFIHYSSLWIDFFQNGSVEVDDSMLLPIYPCNIIMWMLLIVAFFKNKKSKFYIVLSEFVFLVGTLCGVVGEVVNENYLNAGSIDSYHVLKGLLSHSTMVFGTMYLYAFEYVKISTVRNSISCVCGGLYFLLNGFIINSLFTKFSIPSVNSMYLQEPPFPDVPQINVLVLGLAALILIVLLTSIYELIFYKKEDRSIYKLVKGKIIYE